MLVPNFDIVLWLCKVLPLSKTGSKSHGHLPVHFFSNFLLIYNYLKIMKNFHIPGALESSLVQILVLLLINVDKLFGHSKLLFLSVLNKDKNISWPFN